MLRKCIDLKWIEDFFSGITDADLFLNWSTSTRSVSNPLLAIPKLLDVFMQVASGSLRFTTSGSSTATSNRATS